MTAIVNRGFMIVRAKSPFVNWANGKDDEFYLIGQNPEPSVYLIEEDFMETETILKASFKRIFLNELHGVSDNESDFPEITMSNFEAWFDIEFGGIVCDLEKAVLSRE